MVVALLTVPTTFAISGARGDVGDPFIVRRVDELSFEGVSIAGITFAHGCVDVQGFEEDCRFAQTFRGQGLLCRSRCTDLEIRFGRKALIGASVDAISHTADSNFIVRLRLDCNRDTTTCSL
jgi:hypothetical protein